MKKKYSDLTTEDRKTIIDFYYKHKEIKVGDMNRYLNVSKRTLRQVLVDAGINTKLKNRYVIQNENYFENIDTEFKAYILGFIYADGFVGDHDDFCFGLSDKCEDNYKLLNYFKEELGTNLNVLQTKTQDGYGHYIFKFSKKKIVSDLNKLGVFPRKSLNMTYFPNIPEQHMNHFIRGYFDGDGSIFTYYDSYDKRKRYCMEILGTPDFLEQMQLVICNCCNVKHTRLHDVKRIPGLTRIAYKGINSLVKIREYLYKNATYYLAYKHDRFYNIQPL